MKTIFKSILIGCLLVSNVWAEHEADHRYNIRGYVLDANQNGIQKLTVQVFAKRELLGTSKTDTNGYYSLILHLHNEDYGRVLGIRAGPHKAEFRVKFDLEDHTSIRAHEANFVDGKYVEGQLDRFRIPSWSYAVGGLFLLIMIAIFLEKRRKKKIRLAKYGSTMKQSQSTHKAKKVKRKKH
jgi:hypothetical protein